MTLKALYPPDLYALIHRGNPGDAAFYARHVKGAASVLELGAGYGRLISTLAKTGAAYQGLELDPAFLKLASKVRTALPEAQRKRVRLRHGDMRDFAFKQRFERVILPYSTLYCLQSERDVLRCLKQARAHVTDKGELLLDAYFADGFHRDLDPDEMTGKERDFLTSVTSKKGKYQVFERTRWSRAQQKFKVTYEYENERGELTKGVVLHRYLLKDQLTALLERAGFAVVSLAGDFAGKRLGIRSEHIVVRARPV